MTAPKPEHIDAVSQLVHVWIVDCNMYGPDDEGKYLCKIHDEFTENDAYCGAVGEAAQRFLNSDDPAVHAAMLDALTRHGVLTEDKYAHMAGYTRLATVWEVAP